MLFRSESDSYIMGTVIASKELANGQLRRASCARLRLDARAVSGMPRVPGEELGGALVAGDFKRSSSLSRGRGASQGKPTCKDAWKLRRKACSLLREKNGKLKAKLGRWLAPSNMLRRRWACFCSPSQDALLRWAGAGIVKHKAAAVQFFARRRFYRPGSNIEEWGQPPGALPADAQRGRARRCAAAASKAERMACAPPPVPVPLGFFQYTEALPLVEKKMLYRVKFFQGPMLVAQAMLEAKGKGCLPCAASGGSATNASHAKALHDGLNSCCLEMLAACFASLD